MNSLTIGQNFPSSETETIWFHDDDLTPVSSCNTGELKWNRTFQSPISHWTQGTSRVALPYSKESLQNQRTLPSFDFWSLMWHSMCEELQYFPHPNYYSREMNLFRIFLPLKMLDCSSKRSSHSNNDHIQSSNSVSNEFHCSPVSRIQIPMDRKCLHFDTVGACNTKRNCNLNSTYSLHIHSRNSKATQNTKKKANL